MAGLGIFSLADQTLEAFYKAVILPFLISYLIFMIVPMCVVIAILTDCLAVSKWFALLNSLVFLVIGVALRKLKKEWFYNLPGIIMPSLGLAMLGLIGIVNLL